MDSSVALILGQDGITNGAIYALLALALVLVFAVTRVIFIQQGEFVAYGALTLAMMQSGALPATVWLLVVMGVLVTVFDGGRALKAGQGRCALVTSGSARLADASARSAAAALSPNWRDSERRQTSGVVSGL